MRLRITQRLRYVVCVPRDYATSAKNQETGIADTGVAHSVREAAGRAAAISRAPGRERPDTGMPCHRAPPRPPPARWIPCSAHRAVDTDRPMDHRAWRTLRHRRDFVPEAGPSAGAAADDVPISCPMPRVTGLLDNILCGSPGPSSGFRRGDRPQSMKTHREGRSQTSWPNLIVVTPANVLEPPW
jgi:hypothetical protein